MSLTSHRLSRAAIVAVLAAAGAFFAPGVDPAMALCKYGGPHCVDPHKVPKSLQTGGTKIPDSNWQDEDCKHYNNCQTTAARRAPGGAKLQPATERATKR
jgi:hypothetical protein